MRIKAIRGQVIKLGHTGENLVRTVTFDVSAWITEFGSSGTVVLLHQRYGDDAPYPVAITLADGIVTWAVTSADVARAGSGEAELQYVIGEQVVKSERWHTSVASSLDAPGTAPDPQSGWVAELLQQVQDTASGLTSDFKTALLACFEHVAWIDEDGQDYYDALEDALYPPVTVTSITAAYTPGSHVVYEGDALSTLIPYLTVTARDSDYSTGTVASTDYTLSGTLTAGTSVVTVSYEGVTTTVNVVVQPPVGLSSISAVFTQGSNVIYDTDSLDTLKQYLVVTAHYSDNTTETVADTDYTLSGTLAEGTSTITVSYGGETATFSVTVTEFVELTQQITWSGSGVENTTGSTLIDATEHDIYFQLPFIDGATQFADGATAESVPVRFDALLYTDSAGTTGAGIYCSDTQEIEATERTTMSKPVLAFNTDTLVAPRGYYVKLRAFKQAAFSSNSTCRSYLNAYGNSVTLR